MLVLWRGILITLCCFAVVICYPYYSDNAIKIMVTWAVIAFVLSTILTLLTKALLIGKLHFFNVILDVAIVLIFLYVLLNIFPQISGKSPFSQLRKGIYPTSEEIDVGLANLGLKTRKQTISDFQQGIDVVTDDINEVKDLFLREYNKQ